MRLETQQREAVETPVTGSVGVRLYTRAPLTLSWLSRTVVPAARRLRDDGVAIVYLRRGWLHGPHVDLVGHGGRPVDWPAVADDLDPGPVPDGAALTEEAYLAQAREFGRLESVPPPYLPMAEHGATGLLGPDDVGSRQEAFRGMREWEIVTGTLCPPLLDMIDELARRPAAGTVRLAEAFCALADSYFLGLGHGVYSFRSHAEAFLAWAAPTRDVRPAFAERLAREAAVLRPVVEQRLAGEVGPAAAAWRTAFAYCAGTLDNAVTGGSLTLEMLDAASVRDLTGMGPPGAPEVVPEGDQPHTVFHRTLAESGITGAPTQWFAAYRLLINLFYQQLPLLTVAPMQRYYMCYAIAELVDEVLGETWRERLSRQRPRVVTGRGA